MLQIHHPRRTASGFTLIELLIVVIILGVLAAAGISKYQNFASQARANTCISNQKQINNAISVWEAKNGKIKNSALRFQTDGAVILNGSSFFAYDQGVTTSGVQQNASNIARLYARTRNPDTGTAGDKYFIFREVSDANTFKCPEMIRLIGAGYTTLNPANFNTNEFRVHNGTAGAGDFDWTYAFTSAGLNGDSSNPRYGDGEAILPGTGFVITAPGTAPSAATGLGPYYQNRMYGDSTGQSSIGGDQSGDQMDGSGPDNLPRSVACYAYGIIPAETVNGNSMLDDIGESFGGGVDGTQLLYHAVSRTSN